MAEVREEELGEGRHQASGNGAYEERIKGAPSTLRGGGAGLKHPRPVDALRRRHPAQPCEARLRHVWRLQGRRVPSSGRGLTRRHGFWITQSKQIWRFGGRKERRKKGDLSSNRRKQKEQNQGGCRS